MSRPPRKPTFLVLGAAKCGTTSLCTALERHPEIFLSRPKEPRFFESEYDRGLEYYWQKYYAGWRGEPVVGEGRVYNLYLSFVPERIRESLPHARLVAVLRDPVQRAYSHWWHRVTRGYEQRGFAETVRQELQEAATGAQFQAARDPAAWQQNSFPGAQPTEADAREVRYLEMGYYAEQLSRYRRLFPGNQVRVVIFEDMVERPGPTLLELLEFLGADPDRGAAGLPSRNAALGRRKGRVAFLLERVAWALRLNRLMPKQVRTAVRRALSSRAERPEMEEDVRRRLYAHYGPRNRELEEFIERSLSAWRLEAGAAVT